MGSSQSSTSCTKQSNEVILQNTTVRSPYMKRATLEETAKISVQYGNYLACKRRQLLKQIKLSNSRRNGFNSLDVEDTETEHWSWSPNNSYDERLQLQAVNCSACGNYKQVTDANFILCDRIVCGCDNDNDVWTINTEEYKECDRVVYRDDHTI
jgi:hypothetical protein